jgi:hypothetical protein
MGAACAALTPCQKQKWNASGVDKIKAQDWGLHSQTLLGIATPQGPFEPPFDAEIFMPRLQPAIPLLTTQITVIQYTNTLN